MDELFASGMKLAYPPGYSSIFEYGDEAEASKVLGNLANCPSYEFYVKWAINHKNLSLMMLETSAEINYATGIFLARTRNPYYAS